MVNDRRGSRFLAGLILTFATLGIAVGYVFFLGVIFALTT